MNPSLHRTLPILAALALGAGVKRAEAANNSVTWTAGTGAFASGENWSTGLIPDSGDNAIIDNGGTAQVGGDDFLTPTQITVSNGAIEQTGGLIQVPQVNSSDYTVRVGSLSGTASLTMSGDSFFTAGYRFYVADGNGSSTAISNASVSLTDRAQLSVVDYFVIGRQGGNGTMTVSGDASIAKTGGGGWFIVGEGAGSGTLTLNDNATATMAEHGIYIGSSESGNGTVYVNDNATLSSVAYIILGNGNATATGKLYINGGTVVADSIQKGSGTGTVYINGGTVKAGEDNANYFTSFEDSSLVLQSGGMKFDTNGHAVTITQSLGGDGGVTKLGAGDLTLSGFSTFTGPMTIAEGSVFLMGSLDGVTSLSLASDTVLTLYSEVSLNDEIVLTLDGGSTLDLEFAGTETIGALQIDGIFLAAGVYTLEDLQNLGSAVTFTGDPSALLNVVSAVPEPSACALLIGSALGLGAWGRRRLTAAARA